MSDVENVDRGLGNNLAIFFFFWKTYSARTFYNCWRLEFSIFHAKLFGKLICVGRLRNAPPPTMPSERSRGPVNASPAKRINVGTLKRRNCSKFANVPKTTRRYSRLSVKLLTWIIVTISQVEILPSISFLSHGTFKCILTSYYSRVAGAGSTFRIFRPKWNEMKNNGLFLPNQVQNVQICRLKLVVMMVSKPWTFEMSWKSHKSSERLENLIFIHH